jgi:hypothetical protein
MPRSAYQIDTKLTQSFFVALDHTPQESPPVNISLELYALFPKNNHPLMLSCSCSAKSDFNMVLKMWSTKTYFRYADNTAEKTCSTLIVCMHLLFVQSEYLWLWAVRQGLQDKCE